MPKERITQEEAVKRIKYLGCFLKRVEVYYPDLKDQFSGLLMRMVGNQTFDPAKIVEAEKYIGVGMAILGECLNKNGFGGFSVNLTTGESLMKEMAVRFVSLPVNRDEFFRNSGIRPEIWPRLNTAVGELSQNIGSVLECGYTPKQVVGTLFYESSLPQGRETVSTSVVARSMMDRLSGGRMNEINAVMARWVRNQ